MVDMLKTEGAPHIKVVVGGGGTIAPHEVEALEAYGIAKIYTPDDGLKLGLDGMIEDVFRRVRATPRPEFEGSSISADDPVNLARAITLLEQGDEAAIARLRSHAAKTLQRPPVVGLTGTGGAGKSSLTDELLNRMVRSFPERRVAVVAMDPTRRRSGGALLGDRIRMNSLANGQLFMRSLATRRQHLATSAVLADTVQLLKSAGLTSSWWRRPGSGRATPKSWISSTCPCT
jgi:methylmalonyl-CoA mutase